MPRQSLGCMILLVLMAVVGNPQTINNAHANSTEMETVTVNNKHQKIILSINGQEAIVILDNNSASKSFAAMLPLDIAFEEYNIGSLKAQPSR